LNDENEHHHFVYSKEDTLRIAGYIKKLNDAIEFDRTNQLYYTSQVKYFLILGNVDGAIRIMKKCIEIKPHFVEAMTGLGFLYEKKNDTINAPKAYKKALEEYRSRKSLSFNDEINRAILLNLVKGRNNALAELDSILTRHPDQVQTVHFWQNQLQSFNRGKFIEDVLR